MGMRRESWGFPPITILERRPMPQDTYTEIKTPADTAEIQITAEDAERMTSGGKGPTVAEIDVINKDGTYSRFFINIGINKQNRPVCEVSTNTNAPHGSVRKTVTAVRKMPVVCDE